MVQRYGPAELAAASTRGAGTGRRAVAAGVAAWGTSAAGRRCPHPLERAAAAQHASVLLSSLSSAGDCRRSGGEIEEGNLNICHC